jgi:hypothetical protein
MVSASCATSRIAGHVVFCGQTWKPIRTATD